MKFLMPVLAAALVALVLVPVTAQESAPVDTSVKPALSVAEWIKGDPVSLEDGKGKNIYVVEFWATWCPPCRETIPHLTELQKKYKDDNVVVVGVTDEDPQWVKSFVEKMGDDMDYRVAIDKESKTYELFDKISPLPGIPFAYVIDKDGRVVWRGFPLGGLEEVLNELTGKAKSDAPSKTPSDDSASPA